jgi:hypothetical protein
MTLRSAAALLLAAALLPACASAGDEGGPVAFSAAAGPIGDFAIPVDSVEDRRFASVVRQRYDFSCGSAALATLLRYHYGGRQDEAQVFRGMWMEGDRDQIRRLGFSLLDMKRYLAAKGIAADGFQVSLEEVAAAGVPGIALINLNGYRHFVVVKGVADGEVLVGDPALGLRVMPAEEFRAAWNGVYFALNSKLEAGRASFNRDAQWASFSRAPVGAGFSNPLSQQALMLTAPSIGEF